MLYQAVDQNTSPMPPVQFVLARAQLKTQGPEAAKPVPRCWSGKRTMHGFEARSSGSGAKGAVDPNARVDRGGEMISEEVRINDKRYAKVIGAEGPVMIFPAVITKLFVVRSYLLPGISCYRTITGPVLPTILRGSRVRPRNKISTYPTAIDLRIAIVCWKDIAVHADDRNRLSHVPSCVPFEEVGCRSQVVIASNQHIPYRCFHTFVEGGRSPLVVGKFHRSNWDVLRMISQDLRTVVDNSVQNDNHFPQHFCLLTRESVEKPWEPTSSPVARYDYGNIHRTIRPKGIGAAQMRRIRCRDWFSGATRRPRIRRKRSTVMLRLSAAVNTSWSRTRPCRPDHFWL